MNDLPQSKKVRAVIRADDVQALLSFHANNRNKGVQLFYIPKGYDIRIIDNDVYFDNVREDVNVIEPRVTLIAYTPDITMVGLIDGKEISNFSERPIKVSTFKLKL